MKPRSARDRSAADSRLTRSRFACARSRAAVAWAMSPPLRLKSGSERVVRGDVLELAGVNLREPHVQLARVPHLAPQLRHPEQAVGIARCATRQPRVSERGEGPRISGVHVESDRGAPEGEAVARGV